ncbi:hypothetical protein KXS07_37270 [Inquilinus limosus]|uniref:hypothetical protein n=1 Tax=Inquilinus limosus TaxID=171674 RepID=UPI003F16472A
MAGFCGGFLLIDNEFRKLIKLIEVIFELVLEFLEIYRIVSYRLGRSLGIPETWLGFSVGWCSDAAAFGERQMHDVETPTVDVAALLYGGVGDEQRSHQADDCQHPRGQSHSPDSISGGLAAGGRALCLDVTRLGSDWQAPHGHADDNALNGLGVIEGDDGDNTLRGLAGNDLIYGKGGHDDLNGGFGEDELHGGAGDDCLRGLGAGWENAW